MNKRKRNTNLAKEKDKMMLRPRRIGTSSINFELSFFSERTISIA